MTADRQLQLDNDDLGTQHRSRRLKVFALVAGAAGLGVLAVAALGVGEEPPCLSEGRGEHAIQVIAAQPADRTGSDRSSTVAAITKTVRQADDYLAASGPGHRIRWACEDGELSILEVTTPAVATEGEITFADVVAAVVEQGHDRSDRLYAIFYPPRSGYDEVGEATGPGDASKGPQYSMVVEWTGYWTLHEVGHTLGAVASKAPHQFASGHCYELNDVMCRRVEDLDDPTYADVVEMNCPEAPEWLFDCNHDDYYLHEGDWWDVADSPYLYLAPPQHRPASVERDQSR